jgi:hypothetical protein
VLVFGQPQTPSINDVLALARRDHVVQALRAA